MYDTMQQTYVSETKVKRQRKSKFATDEERLESRREANRRSLRKTRDNCLRLLRKYYEENREYVRERNRIYTQKQRDLLKEFRRLSNITI